MEVWKFHYDCLGHQSYGTNNRETLYVLTDDQRSLRCRSWHLFKHGKFFLDIWVKDEALAIQTRRLRSDCLLQWDDDSIVRVGFVLWWRMGLSQWQCEIHETNGKW